MTLEIAPKSNRQPAAKTEDMSRVQTVTSDPVQLVERRTLCLSGGDPGTTIHHGEDAFKTSSEELFVTHENNAAESFVLLKTQLRLLEGDDFYSHLTKQVALLLGAQYVLVSKRVLQDDVNSTVEIPEFGAPGSCFSAVSMYFNDGTQEQHTKGFEYPVQGSLCAHMRHDKVFLVPSHLANFIQDLASQFAVPVESHFAIPLCDDEGRCFAHIGVFWSVEGEKARTLSWGFIEMMLHALEDVCVRRLLASRRANAKASGKKQISTAASRAVVNSTHSLKPFARSLSHELRTPMHGVVGMLDIMHATVQEALESQTGEDVAQIFRTLKDNIENIQDSSRRAVEAADNVVQAYDFDMQVPDNENTVETTAAAVEAATVSQEEGARPLHQVSAERDHLKRRRSISLDMSTISAQPHAKHRIIELPPRSATPNMAALTPHTAALKSIVKESSRITEAESSLTNMAKDLPHSAHNTKFTRVRDILQVVVSESLRFGGRPDSAIATETEHGERIEVRNRGSDGHASTKIIDWSVDPSVPEEVLIDERDFAKLVSVLFLNALKFTEQGSVRLHVSISPRSRFVVLNVMDTGMGIPVAFRPYLFKAFARGDDSLTRQNEGLGLGLMVAKSLARRVGGDLVCVRSDTRGPNRGSEFELRIPLTAPSDGTRSYTPSRTPTPLPSETTLELQEPGLVTGEREASLASFRYAGTSTPTATSALQHHQHLHDLSPHSSPTLSSVPPQQVAQPSTPPLVELGTRALTQPSTPFLTHPSTPSTPSLLNPPNPLAGAALTHAPNPPSGTAITPRRLSQNLSHSFDRSLAVKYPLNVLVAEDNKINRKLLVNMLGKLGYQGVHEAFDGAEAVRLMEMDRLKPPDRHIDVILMDLWMPHMDGYEAARRILAMQRSRYVASHLRILAVTADATDTALDRAREVGMHGIMTKPYKMADLERLIVDFGPPVKMTAAAGA